MAYNANEVSGIYGGEVWDDLNFDPSASGGPAVSVPDYVIINDTVYREFTNANNQICGAGEEVPHGAKLNATFYPHLHCFLKTGENAGSTGVTFTIYWQLREVGGLITSGSVPLTATSAQLAAESAKLDLYDNTGFAGSTKLGGQIALTLARTAGDAGDVIVLTYGIHYPLDSVGSRLITTKW